MKLLLVIKNIMKKEQKMHNCEDETTEKENVKNEKGDNGAQEPDRDGGIETAERDDKGNGHHS